MATHLQSCLLHKSHTVSIFDVRCRSCCRDCGGEEWAEAHQVVFVRAGVFVKRNGNCKLVADPNKVLFFNRHEVYRVSHPGDGGDDCSVFIFPPVLLREVIAAYQPAGEEWNERPFEFGHVLSSQQSFLLHQRLRQHLLSPGTDPLAIDELALRLFEEWVEFGYGLRGVQARGGRPSTAQAHRDQAGAAELVLATRFAENMGLNDIARSVLSSPFHLARVFRQETGLSMHQYRNRLRLRAALERIGAGANDLTGLALDLGFSSHSHFIDVFRRSFGVAPSQCRHLPLSRLRELSRNLKADERLLR